MASNGLLAFEKRMVQLASAYGEGPAKIVQDMGFTYRDAIKTEIDAATNGGILRGVGAYNGGSRTGARVGVQKINLAPSEVLLQATGPLHLIENDTSAHTIPQTTRTRRLRTTSGKLSRKRVSTGKAVSGVQPLKINGTWVMGPVHHPGTRGKHPFEKGIIAGSAAVTTQAFETFYAGVRSIFGV